MFSENKEESEKSMRKIRKTVRVALYRVEQYIIPI